MPPKPTPTSGTAGAGVIPTNSSAAVKAAAAISTTATANKQPTTKKIVTVKVDPAKYQPQPIIKKPSALTVNTGAAPIKAVGETIKFTSSASSPKGSPKSTAPADLAEIKLKRGQQAMKDLKHMDAIERAFREDINVWTGPTNVVFSRRTHNIDVDEEEDGVSGAKKQKKSSIANPYLTSYCGGQSQGWMYGEGFAGVGGRSWMEAVSSTNDKEEDNQQITANENNSQTNNKSFLMDDVTIIDNALKANGLTRHDVTPKAYACFLEQSRRYSLELLANAQDYAIHAQRTTIPSLLPADLLLAVEMTEEDGGGINGVSTTLPSPEKLSDLSTTVNRITLPPIPTNCYNGVALPPAHEQLTARTYDVVNGARARQRMARGGDLPLTGDDFGDILVKDGASSSAASKQNKVSIGGYGAEKGRQIAVRIKGKDGMDIDGGTVAIESAQVEAAKTKKKSGQKRTLTEL